MNGRSFHPGDSISQSSLRSAEPGSRRMKSRHSPELIDRKNGEGISTGNLLDAPPTTLREMNQRMLSRNEKVRAVRGSLRILWLDHLIRPDPNERTDERTDGRRVSTPVNT